MDENRQDATLNEQQGAGMDWMPQDAATNADRADGPDGDQPKGKSKKGKEKKSVGQEIREWVVALVVAVVVVLVLQNFLFTIIRVDGASMNPNLANNERLFVTVADVKFGQVERNSVVICHYPDRTNKFLLVFTVPTNFVKRVVGLPGDTVYCKNGVTHIVQTDVADVTISVNDEGVEQATLPGGLTATLVQDGMYAADTGVVIYKTDDGLYNVDSSLDIQLYGSTRHDYDPYVLGEDEYFVVGDNRYNSHDSRDWAGPDAEEGHTGNDTDAYNNVGPISKDMIVGRVREVFWPLGKIRAVGTLDDITADGVGAPYPPTR